VPPGSPDAADAARCRPPSDRLRVYSEERSHLPGREQALIVAIHGSPLLSPFRSMSSVSRKHPFTSLFSPKMSGWCRLSASGLAGGPGARARRAGSRRDLAGCAREVAGCRCRAPRRGTGVAGCAVPDYGMCKALLRTRCDCREFADSGAYTADRFCGQSRYPVMRMMRERLGAGIGTRA
jgi:hypothetical protein